MDSRTKSYYVLFWCKPLLVVSFNCKSLCSYDVDVVSNMAMLRLSISSFCKWVFDCWLYWEFFLIPHYFIAYACDELMLRGLYKTPSGSSMLCYDLGWSWVVTLSFLSDTRQMHFELFEESFPWRSFSVFTTSYANENMQPNYRATHIISFDT